MSSRSRLALVAVLAACRPGEPHVVRGSAAMLVTQPRAEWYHRQPAWREAHVLRVCADPNNLPFSNQRGEGFENHIAELIAADIGARVEYTWWPQRRGFVRNTLKYGSCDVILGVPTSYDLVLATPPYYRSTYVFVSRRHRNLHVRSLDDPALRRLRIGFHVMGDDYANSPAEMALARRGLVANGRGITVYGDYSRPNPPADLMHAVENGDVDVAIAWGPLAGYYATQSRTAFNIEPVTPQVDIPFLQFAFDISAGVRRGDTLTRAMLEREFTRRRVEVDSLLREFGVPLLGPGGAAQVAVKR